MSDKSIPNEEKRLYDSEEERVRASAEGLFKDFIANTTIESNIRIYTRYLNSYKISGASPYTIRNHVTALRTFGQFITKPVNELTYDDIEEILIRIEGLNLSATSKKVYKVRLKTLLKFAGLKELSESIKTGNRRSHKKLPDDLLTRDEVAMLIDNALNPRDKALISLLYESGARLGEMLSLKIKHIEPHPKGTYIQFPQGKTGARRILVVFSGMYLNQWLVTHPDRNNREAYVWCQIRPPHAQLSVSSFRTAIKKAGKRAKIDKPMNPHAFRHAQATELAKDFTEAQMKSYLGWVADSNMASVYVHLSGRDIENAVLEKNGIEIEKRDTRLKADECPRCHKMLPQDAVFCGFCGMPLTSTATQTSNALLQQGLSMIPDEDLLRLIKDAIMRKNSN